MKSWEDQPNAQDLAIYLVGFLWDMRAFLWAHSSDHALTWGATDSAHMSLRRGTFRVDQPSGVDQPGLHQLESIATWRRVPQLLSRDLSWVITESFATREFSWPPCYVIAFFRTWTILNPGHVSPTSKDPSRCKPQRHLHPWGSDSMVSRRGGRSLQWKIDIRRYRVSNTGFLIPMGLVIILSHFPSESGLGLRSRSWRWRVATTIWNKARTPSMWQLRWGRTFFCDFGKITQMSGKTYVQKKWGSSS